MKIAVAGTGYVGLSIACLLAQRNEVIALDVIKEKVDMINAGKSPIRDKEIEDFLANKKLDLKIDLIKKDGYKDYLFLPFSDLTCGKDSYIGGRYIDMRIPKSNTVLIDFNKAYNPYCAYSYKYSCPIVPLDNDLDIEILAGVKKFHD